MLFLAHNVSTLYPRPSSDIFPWNHQCHSFFIGLTVLHTHLWCAMNTTFRSSTFDLLPMYFLWNHPCLQSIAKFNTNETNLSINLFLMTLSIFFLFYYLLIYFLKGGKRFQIQKVCLVKNKPSKYYFLSGPIEMGFTVSIFRQLYSHFIFVWGLNWLIHLLLLNLA